jgi:hypothetical protein
MTDIGELDNLIAASVREFEMQQLNRRLVNEAEREKVLYQTLGPKVQPLAGESFVVGDPIAGVTEKSVWFQSRRVHFAVVLSIAVGSAGNNKGHTYWVDVNCTLNRSYRIRVPTMLDTDNFLVALARFMSFKIVPTVESEIREQHRIEELAAATEANVERRQRRMELLAIRQQQLLRDLIQVECAPRITFGVIY